MGGNRRQGWGQCVKRVDTQSDHGAVVEPADLGHKAVELWIKGIGKDVGRVRLQGDEAGGCGDAGGEDIEECAAAAAYEVGAQYGIDRLALQLVNLTADKAG